MTEQLLSTKRPLEGDAGSKNEGGDVAHGVNNNKMQKDQSGTAAVTSVNNDNTSNNNVVHKAEGKAVVNDSSVRNKRVGEVENSDEMDIEKVDDGSTSFKKKSEPNDGNYKANDNNDRDGSTANRGEDQQQASSSFQRDSAEVVEIKDNDDQEEESIQTGMYYQLPIIGEHKKAVSSISFAPLLHADQGPESVFQAFSAALVASGSADATVKLWDVKESVLYQPPGSARKSSNIRKLKPIGMFEGHQLGINDVAWNCNSQFLATASDDRSVRLWDVETQVALVEYLGHENFVFSCQFNPQSNLIVSGSFDETVKVWDVRSGECVQTLPAHSDPVTSVDFNRDGTCIVSASYDGLIRIWDTATGESLKTIYAESSPAVSYVKFSPNGKYLLANTLDSKIRLWDITKPSHKGTKTYAGGHISSKFCSFSCFGVANNQCPSIITGSEDGSLFFYDLQTRKVKQVIRNAHNGPVLGVGASSKREIVVTGGLMDDRTVKFWAVKQDETAAAGFNLNSNDQVMMESSSEQPLVHNLDHSSGGGVLSASHGHDVSGLPQHQGPSHHVRSKFNTML